MLKIRSAADPIVVKQLVIAIYAPPGVGKTTLAFSAADPILLDFDAGAHRAMNRGDSVEVTRWQDVNAITDDDLAPFKTVVVDTAGRALDALTADIIRRDAKAGQGGVLSQQGWGKLKGEFGAWLKGVRQAGKDVILVAHMSEKPQGDDMIERLDVQGGSKDEIYKSADAMGRVVIKDGKRWLYFDPTDTAYGKNPGRLPALEIPSPITPDFFAGVVQQIKDALNAETEAQRERAALIRTWSEKVATLTDAAGFNAIMPEVKALPRPVQKIVADAARKAGLVYDAGAGGWQAEPVPEPGPEPQAQDGVSAGAGEAPDGAAPTGAPEDAPPARARGGRGRGRQAAEDAGQSEGERQAEREQGLA